MVIMRDVPLSNLERQFLLDALEESKRLDGRSTPQRRPLELHFGRVEGTALVSVGETQSDHASLVYAQASASIAEPAVSRPIEGMLNIFVTYCGSAAARFADAAGTAGGDEAVEVTRLLERCLKESRCLDLESLCIVAEEKVWQIRLDVNILSAAAGGVADAASVAALAALAHFKRPEIHPVSERDPVALAIHHYPVLSTFAFFNRQKSGSNAEKIVCVDPTWQEEQVMAGKISVVLRYAHVASQHAKSVVDLIKNQLHEDTQKRLAGQTEEIGFAFAFKQNSILQNVKPAEMVSTANLEHV
eukprot:TCALIF_00612-PA protein Name:"Similar to EXOSC9 Exosome complex component RRP45 (Bos taurus)" AED:0.13 eAED:0.15 QI:0/0/0/0.75/0.33/0.5/4/0/301